MFLTSMACAFAVFATLFGATAHASVGGPCDGIFTAPNPLEYVALTSSKPSPPVTSRRSSTTSTSGSELKEYGATQPPGSRELTSSVPGDGADNQREKQGHQAYPNCSYVIPTEEEAISRGRDSSVPGNILFVKDFHFARTGNRLVALRRTLNLGFCCKSKLVSLPPKEEDEILSPGIFSEGTPGPRWFDFSDAPDVKGFNASSCPAEITWDGSGPFYQTGLEDQDHPYYTPGLRTCVENLPRLIGCEAAYYFPIDVDVCSSSNSGNDEGKPVIKVRVETETKEGEWREEQSDGDLAIHVRSGDIFVDPVHDGHGQVTMYIA